MEYGYCRVSTREQNEERQVTAMLRVSILKKNIYVDKQSGKNFQREEYKRLLKKLKPDDVVYVKSISRLGRNYEEVTEQWRYLTKTKKVDIVVLDMPLLDTRQAKDLLGTLLSDLVLQVLSYVAEQELKHNKSTQAEGIAVAIKNGVKFGRPRIMSEEEFKEQYIRYKNKGYKNTEIRKNMNFSVSSFYRYLRYVEEKGMILDRKKAQ